MTAADPLELFTSHIEVERRQIVCRAEIEGEPIPWARAGRGIKGQSYTPRRYAEHRDSVGWALTNGRIGARWPLMVDIGLWVTFYRSTRRRVDIDNLIKAVLDGGNGVVWADDAQVNLVVARILVDHDLPRTEVVAFRRELQIDTTAGVP